MSFPWAIKINTKTVRKDAARLAALRLRRKSLRLLVFLALSRATSVLDTSVAMAEPLPTTLPQQGNITSGSASIQSIASAMTINQQSQKVIIKWQSFNIGRDASVEFKQPNATSTALNQILQGSPSEIFGKLSANGQVYLINQNGIVFGASAQIDAHSLVASTLNLSDEVFNNIGLVNAINSKTAAFEAAGVMGAIEIQSGAVLKTAEGGRIMIFAPTIKNSGEITTPGGQTILAASKDQVYLAADDENTRGLLVEVKTGGSIENLGKIIAERGNVSLVGLAVNQSGSVRATTAVNLNGSIRLLARDQATVNVSTDGLGSATASHTGTLILGDNSVTEVAADNLNQTAVDAQTQALSHIELMGNQVILKTGAHIVAPAGNVQIAATKDPANPGPTDANKNLFSDSQFVMESGSRIDVSGLNSAVLPMERNVVAVELRGTQLADSPLQHDGPLYKQTVYIDTRRYGTNADGSSWQGTPLANVSGEIAKVERPLAERLSTGGTISLVSDGKVALAHDSSLNVSGGAIRYQDGYVNTTQLISQGRIYDIADADPSRVYDGVFGTYQVTHKKWGITEVFNIFASQGLSRFESGYVEGKDAGSIAINARNLDVQGTLLGQVMAGRYQRLPQSVDYAGFQRRYDQAPLGGELTLGAAGYSGLNNFSLSSLTDLGAVGINRLQIYANEKIDIPQEANLNLAPGGALTLISNGYVDVAGNITAHGGTVQIKSLGESNTPDPFSAKLGDQASIDVSGQWINDSVALNPETTPQDSVFINGGKVTIEAAGNLFLSAGSVIDASGGAQLQRSGKLQYGKGGAISIIDKPSAANAASGQAADLRLDGELRAYSFSKGGSLNLSGAGFRIGGQIGDAAAHTVYLTPEFFERGGFNNYQLKATHTGISLAPHTDVQLRALNRVLGSQFNLQASGTDPSQLGSLALLPDYQQQAVSLGLSFIRDSNVTAHSASVALESGSSIHAQPGANISLTSDTNLIVDGAIAAPAGNIQMSLVQATSDSQRIFDALQTKSIRLGSQGRLFAGAVYQSVADSSGRGQRLGAVQNGGSVSISANAGQQGYFIASPGSDIDVSGATQILDVTQGVTVTPTAVNGAAGSIDLAAAEGMMLNGDLTAAPGSGAGAAGGALNITLGTDNSSGGTIALTTVASVAPGVNEAIAATLKGKTQINPEKIKTAGFDTLALHSRGKREDANTLAQIKFEGDIDLKLNRSLVLDAPIIASDGGQVKLAASYIAIGPSKSTVLPELTLGKGHLLLQGQHVDLIGTLALRGFEASDTATHSTPVQIISDGDIRLIGGDQFDGNKVNGIYTNGLYSIGSVSSAADMELHAKQIYTATATDFTLSVNRSDAAGQPDGKITIQQNGVSEASLSAASKLTLAAADIEQNGTLRAPFGQIELNASKTLTLGDGSVTSVSGAGKLVPFGKTEVGQDWVYPLGPYQGIYTAPPEKSITLKASQVTLAHGAVVDVTGGGDLLAREHQPGPGGTVDILNADQAKGAFAIVPSSNNLFGSYDPYLATNSSVKIGDTIHLAGGGPLPAGEYALLPAGYALLPGAYLVTPLANSSSPTPGQSLQMFDGSKIVAGQRGVAGTGIRDSLWSAFRIENGTQIRNRAEYLESHIDNFVSTDAGRLNRDAGRLILDAATSLNLAGTLVSNTAGGRGSELDILANRLAVVTSYTGASDRVELLDSGLNNLHADSLLLGASRKHQGADMVLDVRATDVTLAAGTTVSAPEIMLVASDHVSVAPGVTLTAAGDASISAPTSIQLAGDSALVRVSTGDQVRVQRASDVGAKGSLTVAAGAVLDAARSITLDASRDAIVDGDTQTHNGSISFGAARVSLGDAQNVNGGLVLSNERLARLKARELILNSHNSIDVYGQISLNNLDHVALNAAGIAGYRNAAQSVSISADSISLANLSGQNYVASTLPDGSGNLNLAAREVTLGATGENGFTIRGFGNTNISATEQIIAAPESETVVQLHVANDLTLQATRLTATRGADVTIDTQDVGKITLSAPTTLAALGPVSDLGAKLDISASAIDHGTRIELPSGSVSLHAKTGDISIADKASIDVSGRDLAFADMTVGSPGGNVKLLADQGNVNVGTARIDVSSAASGGDAGTLSILAPQGHVQLNPNAQLAGVAQTNGRAGSFVLDTQALTNGFSALNAALHAVDAGFTQNLNLRVRAGDVKIDSNDTVITHDLQLAVDAGKIDVLGRIDASGTQAGQVALYARDDLSLHNAAEIDAHATGVGEPGGKIVLASAHGYVDLPANAHLNVSGNDTNSASANTGTIHVRALRQGNDVAIKPIGAHIDGAERIDIEAYKTYIASGSVDPLIGTIQSETNTYMTNASQIKNTLNIGNDARFHLLPGVEIQSLGDLNLNTNWDLLGWRYASETGVLSLRAAGNLNINQSLSDGVAAVTNELLGTTRDRAQTGTSWSYRLVAGADLAAADSLSVNAGVGNITLSPDAQIRTGTGSIDIAAGNNLVLANNGAAIYTVGENRGTGAMPMQNTGFDADTIQELIYKGDFLGNGGDIRIAVGGDITGASSSQLINEWMPRAAGMVELPTSDGGSINAELPASWAINIDDFRQNIGALGGGDVTLSAGGNLKNLSIVIPTSAKPIANVGGAAEISGGGNLHIVAGGDIRGGVFYVAQGHADIQSGGSVTAENSVYPVLALGDAQFKLTARKDLALEAIVNPTMLPQDPAQGHKDIYDTRAQSTFFTYTDNSAAELAALSGAVVLRGNITALKNAFNLVATITDTSLLSYYPGTLSARSLQDDILVGENGFTLVPAPRGDLELLARNSVVPTGDSVTVRLSDADPNLLPGILTRQPQWNDNAKMELATGHAATPIHKEDKQPVQIVAQTGSIGTAQPSDAKWLEQLAPKDKTSIQQGRNQLSIEVSKQARLYAGQDLRNLALKIQNVDDQDISVVEAGGSILFPTERNTSGFLTADNSIKKFFEIAGPGQFYVIAGKDVDLGVSSGIQSVGNRDNKALSNTGTSITVMAGQAQTPAYDAFIERYLVNEDTYHERLAQYMGELGLSKLDNDTWLEVFQILPLLEKRKFILQVFFNELRTAGISASSVNGADYSRGFDAIKTLFPAQRYQGDVKSFLSQIYTRNGGDINLVVPGGLVNAGVASATGINKKADQLGIAALGSGNINAFVQNDFLVNSSRVFALDGGDILMWTSVGNIDAGKGSKTALAIPPPHTTHDKDANTFVEFPAFVSGSGIRAEVRTSGRKPGDVYLIAPGGVINAGDAGIGTAGNLTIAATAVLGADNIKVGGVATGVPTDGGGLGAGLAGVGDIAATASKVAEDATRGLGAQANERQGFLGVEVIGFGE